MSSSSDTPQYSPDEFAADFAGIYSKKKSQSSSGQQSSSHQRWPRQQPHRQNKNRKKKVTFKNQQQIFPIPIRANRPMFTTRAQVDQAKRKKQNQKKQEMDNIYREIYDSLKSQQVKTDPALFKMYTDMFDPRKGQSTKKRVRQTIKRQNENVRQAQVQKRRGPREQSTVRRRRTPSTYHKHAIHSKHEKDKQKRARKEKSDKRRTRKRQADKRRISRA